MLYKNKKHSLEVNYIIKRILFEIIRTKKQKQKQNQVIIKLL